MTSATTVDAVVAASVGVARLRVCVICPHAEQTHDLLRRLVRHYDRLPLALLQSSRRELPPDLRDDPRVPRPVSQASHLPARHPLAVIATADKLLYESIDPALGRFDLLVCDEAYQLTYSKLAPLFRLARQMLWVGDPGQPRRLVTAPTDRFETAEQRVHWAAPESLSAESQTCPRSDCR